MIRLISTLCFLLSIPVSSYGQSDQDLGLHSEGGPWQFFPAPKPNSNLPNVLLIGNSVMNGFHGYVIDSLKDEANVDYWLTPKHLKSEFLFEDLAAVVASKKYQLIQFNIGLHGWPEGRIGEDEYPILLEKYVKTIQKNSGDAILIWASITPVTETGKAELNRKINPTIAKRNGIAQKIMQKYDIPINDLYSLAVENMHLSKGDRFHWKTEGYRLMAKQSLINILLGLDAFKIDNRVSDYNVIWTSPSDNSLGSMPTGNGDIGINLWVEKNGDLIFYISKTDAWSENARLLKIGKIRVSLSPNPFTEASPFRQELVLQDGLIHIDAGKGKENISIDAWVDANNPVIELNINSQSPIEASVRSEIWRTSQREIENQNEIHSAYGLNGAGGPVVIVEKDTVLNTYPKSIVWAHRNERSIWQDNLKLQGLEEAIKTGKDPLLYRTFGCMINSPQLTKVNGTLLKTEAPTTSLSVSAIVSTQQTERLSRWQEHIEKTALDIQSQSKSSRLLYHKNWWRSFWERSYIHVSSSDKNEAKNAFTVSQGYALQRYMIACSGRGNSPIKFNGSIFNVDTEFIEGKFKGLDADFRQWGGPYWFQNTRLPYWTMLESGDFEMMEPLFKIFLDALPSRKIATQTYYGHDGAFYPETMYFWGAYADANYGRDRSELEPGLTENRYIRYYWQGGLELSLIMLDYYVFTNEVPFLQNTLIPFVSEILTFYDQHWKRGSNGKILFSPAMSLETFHSAVDPLPEIAGIQTIAKKMLALPHSYTTDKQRKQWRILIDDLPDIPLRVVNGKTVLSPAAEYSVKANSENPELYAIFPYRMYTLGKPDLDVAKNAFDIRLHKENGGWQQNSIQAAYLGLSDEAKRMVIQSFSTWDQNYRFIAFWGPNYDWTPDQDHGSVAMNALQRMILQYDGDSVQLMPAWPNEWDVEFKLHGPDNKTHIGVFKDGSMININ